MRYQPLVLSILAILSVGQTQAPATDLAKIDRSIAKEPAYKTKPKYCLLVFGAEAKHRVWLVVDGDMLYVDRNGNGDLTEPGNKIAAEKKNERGVDYHVRETPTDRKNYQFRLEVLESATGKKIASLAAAANEGFSAKFSPDGQTLAADNCRNFTTKEPKLVLFSIPENRVLKTINLGKETKGERLIVSEPVFSPDGKRLAIITQVFPDTLDNVADALDLPQPRIHLIDVANGEIRETLVAPQGFSRAACFSQDGRTLAVGGLGRVLLFDVLQPAK